MNHLKVKGQSKAPRSNARDWLGDLTDDEFEMIAGPKDHVDGKPVELAGHTQERRREHETQARWM